MSILNRWQQYGRRYLWSHLLFGVVAAGLGLSTNVVASTHTPLPLSAFSAVKASYAIQHVSIQASLQVSIPAFSKNKPPLQTHNLNNLLKSVAAAQQYTGLWIATSLGIRAGPLQLS